MLVTESRPLLQGARLTVYELAALDIAHELIVDSGRGRADRVRRGRRRDRRLRPRRRQRRRREQGRHLRARARRATRRASRSSSRVPPPRSTRTPVRAARSRSRSATPTRSAAAAGQRLTLAGTTVPQPRLRRYPGAADQRARHRARGASGLPTCGRSRSLAADEGRAVVRARRRPDRGGCPNPSPAPARSSATSSRAACAAPTSPTGTSRRRLPAVLGHELTGVVRAVGAGVDRAAPSEPASRSITTRHAASAGAAGAVTRRCANAFAPPASIPAGLPNACAYPASWSLSCSDSRTSSIRSTATFIEPLACVLRAQDRAGLRAGDSLLVVGAGVNGLLQIAAAHARGVEVVWVREPRQRRLALAEAWGAEHHGNELVDVAIVVHARSRTRSPRPRPALAPGGTLCLYAPPAPDAPPPTRRRPRSTCARSTVTASYSAGPGDMRAALELIAAGRIEPRAAGLASAAARGDRPRARRSSARPVG